MLVFGLGNQAVVVEPEELREAVLKTAEEIIEHYKSMGRGATFLERQHLLY